jgi:tRNA pseudouridine synthase 10
MEKIEILFKRKICDNCIGRQFAQLLSGFTNAERGRAIRTVVAGAIDAGIVSPNDLDLSNFIGYNFRNKDVQEKMKALEERKTACEVCGGIFEHLDEIAARAVKKVSGLEFRTFLVGVRPKRETLEAEEKLWEEFGISYCEPIKVELNREIGKRIESITTAKADLKMPDITFLIDFNKNKITYNIRSVFVFGYYQKIRRGIPQSRWGTPGKYKTSIEEEIGRHLLKIFDGSDHSFHGSGREDIDALCLGWRPFVIEIHNPKKRSANLRDAEKKINRGKYVRVKSLRLVDMDVVRKIKEEHGNKEYVAVVALSKPIKKSELRKLKQLVGQVEQRTPMRVSHRRSDLVRRRRVMRISTSFINSKKFKLRVRCDAGLYIKELISGDKGRTKPSVSEILGQPARCEKLDVVWIEKPKI